MNLKRTVLITTSITILVSMTILMISPVISFDPPIEPVPSTSYERYGPRVDDLLFSAWGSSLAEADALQAGLIDLMDWAAPSSKLDPEGDDWRWDPDITLGDYSEWGMYEFDINTAMWPLGHGGMTPQGWTGSEPAVTSGHYWFTPDNCTRCHDARQFRRALAHLVDRTALTEHMGGYAVAMETFCFPGIIAWENPAAPTYAYSTALAEAALVAGGFDDWDDDPTDIEYSPSHGVIPDDYEELPLLMGYIRSDDPDRTFAGELLRDGLIGLRVPQNFRILSKSECYNAAWVAYDYHVYTGGWGWGRVPDMYSELWHSDKDTYPSAGGDNYARYHSQSYDVQAEGFTNAGTPAEAEVYCDAMQVQAHDDVIAIPLYTYAGYQARATNYAAHPGEAVYAGEPWAGAVNELGAGYISYWNHLNMHPEAFARGGTLRQGLVVTIEKWSPIHAEWTYDWMILAQIYSYLLDYHPLDATQFVPNLAADLPTISSWSYGGDSGTRLSFELLPNILWHDSPLPPAAPFVVTPLDVGFSFKYSRDHVSVDHYYAVKDFYNFITADNGTGWWGPQVGPNTVDILFDVESWLALEWVSGVPIIPMRIWEDKDPAVWNPEDHDAVIGCGPFMCNKDGVPGRIHVTDPDEYVHLEANPTYFRRYIWPDACNDDPAPIRDLKVKISDWNVVSDNVFTYDTRLHPGWDAWDPAWVVDGDQLIDVNKDGSIDTFDLVEIGIRLGHDWPPPHYDFIPPT